MKSNPLLSYTFITFGLIFFSNLQPAVSATVNHIVCNYPINYLSDESYPESAVYPLNPIKGIVSDKEQFIHIRNTRQTGNSGVVQYDSLGYKNSLCQDRIYSKTVHGIVDSVNPLLPYDRFRNLYSSCKSGNGACEFLPDTNTRNSEKSRELLSKPVNLRVDSLTLIAQWDKPRSILIYEDFEGPDFPPQGWQVQTENFTGWYATTDGSSSNFNIPPHTTYSVANDDMDNGNGCCDYLITPVMNLTNLPAYKLYFESFFTSDNNQHAFIEISTDGGMSWDVIYTLIPGPFEWKKVEVDLTQYSGIAGQADLQIAFHADDYGNLATGWAIDNVEISAANDSLMEYALFKDGSLVDNTTEQTYTFSNLIFGQEYLAGVAALYVSGLSDQDTFRFRNSYLSPPRNLEVTIPIATDYAHLTWDVPVLDIDTTVTAPGLSGYNIFKDGVLIAYVEQPSVEYFDLNLMPGTYTYYVTAVYDLAAYGYPGETGESMIQGPVQLSFYCNCDLPFVENFNTGLFETNQWTVDGENWRIAGQVGNDAPSAEFYYNPLTSAYSQSLTSGLLPGVGNVDGYIMLDFDIKHTMSVATGEEFMAIEVYNGISWIKVAEYINNSNTDWEAQSIDITTEAKDKHFKIRFRAHGANTLDIQNWLIDNIKVYRKCNPPVNLAVDNYFPMQYQIRLYWEPPTQNGWIHYDDCSNHDAIGLVNGGAFDAAVRFTEPQLASYSGDFLTKIRMFPYQEGGTITLKVWTGENASNLVLSETVLNYTAGEWNEFPLSAPVFITGSEELWFGYTVIHPAGTLIAGCDAGPSISGSGDMISIDGVNWNPMSTFYDLNYNWNIQGYIGHSDSFSVLKPVADFTSYGTVSELVNGNLPVLKNSTVLNRQSLKDRELISYNVWRDGSILTSTIDTTIIDGPFSPGDFLTYSVTAVYEDCESLFSNEVDIYFPVGIQDVGIPKAEIYPNPSNSVVNIELTNDISQLVVYNYVGQVVYEQVITKDKTIQLNVRNYEAGAYLIKFITNSGESFTRKVAVTH